MDTDLDVFRVERPSLLADLLWLNEAFKEGDPSLKA